MAPYSAINPWGVLADGSVIEGGVGLESLEMLNQVGTRIQMRSLVRIAPDSRSTKFLGEIPTYEYHRDAGDPPRGYLVAFAPVATVAVTADRICTGRGERFEFRCMNANGETELVVRRTVAPVLVTGVARNAFLARLRTLSRTPGHDPVPQARLDQIAKRRHFAVTFPAFDRLVPGPASEVWVSEYKYQARTRPLGEQPPASELTRWNVFPKGGAWVGAVDLPSRFGPTQIGRDFVLGISRDDDGVEGVTLYRLVR